MLRAVLGQKDYLCLAGKGFNVRGIRQAPGAYVTFDDFGKVLLVKGNAALGHGDHLGAIRMTTGNGGSEVGETGRNNCTQVPGSVDPNLHETSRNSCGIRWGRVRACLGSESKLWFTLAFGH